jgi:hypothetical protein
MTARLGREATALGLAPRRATKRDARGVAACAVADVRAAWSAWWSAPA